jgi:Ca2+-transporting ATPase
VATAREAGIAVRTATGAHPAPAQTLGRAIGLSGDLIHARATPADKLALVTRLQAQGEVVAVTGDGVNDAPALRRADVGVAMGASGTEAAREASSIVLTDDNFATIVAAVAEGRRIRDNIGKFVAFLLSANLGEVIAFTVAILAGLGVPLAVVQVLLVNLVTDGLPAVALAQDPADASIMRSPPRTQDQWIGSWRRLTLIGLAVGAVTLGAFEAGQAFGGGVSQTMAFTTLAVSELFIVYAFRSRTQAAWRMPVNHWLNRSVLLSLAIVAVIVYAPFAHEPASTVALPLEAAIVALGLALVPFTLVEIAKLRQPRSERRW